MEKKPTDLFIERHHANLNKIPDAVTEFTRTKKEQAFQEAFRHTVKANSQYLPSHLVAVRNDGGYTLMDYLGTKGIEKPGQSFYHSDTGIYATQDPLSETSVPVVICVENLPREDMMAILGLMESLMTSASIPRRRIPPGFFIFSYRAQWCSGGQEDDPVYREDIVKANSREEALQKLPELLSGQQENYFEMISLEDHDGQRYVKIHDPMLKGKETHSVVSSPYGYKYSA